MPRQQFQWLNAVIGNVKNALHCTCHASGSRRLPHYLAEFPYRFKRSFQLDKMVDRLLQAALRTQLHPAAVA